MFLLLLTGFVAARWLKVTRESLAKLVIYVISPIVFFDILIKSPFSAKLFALPFVYGALCSVLGLLTYHFSKKFFRSPQRNLLSYAAGSANTGYFGIPATAILLGEDKLNTAIFIIIGYNLYEYTTGFYLAARGSFNSRDAFKKVLTLPSIWTFFLAMLVSFMGVNSLPENLHPIMLGFRGSYTTLGIMMVGLGLGTIQNKEINFKFIAVALFSKIIIFPLFAMGLIFLDSLTTHVLDHALREILLLMSLVPMAANGVAIASELKLPTDDIAVSITLSTLLALVWIPLCWATWVPWFLNLLH